MINSSLILISIKPWNHGGGCKILKWTTHKITKRQRLDCIIWSWNSKVRSNIMYRTKVRPDSFHLSVRRPTMVLSRIKKLPPKFSVDAYYQMKVLLNGFSFKRPHTWVLTTNLKASTAFIQHNKRYYHKTLLANCFLKDASLKQKNLRVPKKPTNLHNFPPWFQGPLFSLPNVHQLKATKTITLNNNKKMFLNLFPSVMEIYTK